MKDSLIRVDKLASVSQVRTNESYVRSCKRKEGRKIGGDRAAICKVYSSVKPGGKTNSSLL